MSWQSECGTHEGYLVGLVYDDSGVFAGHAGYARDSVHTSGRLRELGTARDGAALKLAWAKMACSCGWRSPLLRAPEGTEWVPSCVVAPEVFETQCAHLWLLHARASGRAHDGGYSIAELVRLDKAFPREKQ